MDIVQMIQGLLSGELDIDEIAGKAAEKAPPPDMPELDIGATPQGQGDPTQDLLKMIQGAGSATGVKAPEPVAPGAFRVAAPAVGGGAQSQTVLAGLPSLPRAKPEESTLMANLRGAFK